VFERFFRRGSELRRETKGTGLGLAIVKHAVDAHRGRIVVTGDEGEGSCFEITLPVGSEPANGMDGSD
jgi:signal transduction histidine kinase